MRARAVVVISMLAAAAAAARAQAPIRGVVQDARTRKPMECVDLTLTDSAGRVLGSALTRAAGDFSFDAPTAGAYRVRRGRAADRSDAPNAQPIMAGDTKVQVIHFPDRRWTSPLPIEDKSGDSEVVPIPGTGNPTYPDSLRAHGIEGEVLVMFVVDSTGRVNVRGARIIRSSDPLFTDAVREALPRARFRPATSGGKARCQLVQQPFVFALQK